LVSEPLAIWLQVESDIGVDDEELAQLTMRLRRELLDLDVDAVEGVAGVAAPTGAKGPTGESLGTLIVTLSNSAVLAALVGVLRSWVVRGRGRRITIRLGADSLTITGVSAEDQGKLIASWLEQHAQE